MTLNTTTNRASPSKKKSSSMPSSPAAEPDNRSKPFLPMDSKLEDPNPTLIPVARHLFHLLSQFPEYENDISLESELPTSSKHTENAFTNLPYQMSPASLRRYLFLEEQTRNEAIQKQLPYINEADLSNYNSFYDLDYSQEMQRIKMSAARSGHVGRMHHPESQPMCLPRDANAFDNGYFDDGGNKNYPSMPINHKPPPAKNIVSPLRDHSLFDLLDLKTNRARDRYNEGPNQPRYEFNRNSYIMDQDQRHSISRDFETTPHPQSPQPPQAMAETPLGTINVDPMKEDLCPTPESSIHRRICSPRISDNTVDAGYNSTISLTPTTPQPQPISVSLSDLYGKKPELFLHDDW
jgi:hypothetical protein